MPSLIFMLWWEVLGVTTIFFLAGIDAISPELYEAARLDGADELQVVRYVTLPLLKNTLIVWTILRIGAFGVAEPMIALWAGGADAPRSVWTWAFYSWLIGFRTGKLPVGYASAIGWLGATVMVAMALVARRIFREERA
ncbi:MAG: sugar ABC transporter permease, partial [Anaerolineae bacterium]|nr:sugar ABC transporter permease [Anaerolineae bacterium]